MHSAEADFQQQIYSEPFLSPATFDVERLARLKAAVPSLAAHDTIERAVKLQARTDRLAREAELKAKYEAIREAMTELEAVSPRLFAAAIEGEKERSVVKSSRTEAGKLASADGRVPGLFPRQMRVPTETIGNFRWDSEWKRPKEEEPKTEESK